MRPHCSITCKFLPRFHVRAAAAPPPNFFAAEIRRVSLVKRDIRMTTSGRLNHQSVKPARPPLDPEYPSLPRLTASEIALAGRLKLAGPAIASRRRQTVPLSKESQHFSGGVWAAGMSAGAAIRIHRELPRKEARLSRRCSRVSSSGGHKVRGPCAQVFNGRGWGTFRPAVPHGAGTAVEFLAFSCACGFRRK